MWNLWFCNIQKQLDLVLDSIENKLRRETKLSRILNIALNISLPYNGQINKNRKCTLNILLSHKNAAISYIRYWNFKNFISQMDCKGIIFLHLFQSITVPEIIDPVFAKTSLKRSFSMTKYERFGLVFTKTRVYKFGHWVVYDVQCSACRARIFKLFRSPRIDSNEPIPPGL